MRQNLVVLALMMFVAFVGRCSAEATAGDSEDLKVSKLNSPDTLFRPHLISEGNKPTGKRYLRTNNKATSKNGEEERDITAASVLSASVKAMRMKAKLNVMLARGLSPTRVLEKLEVIRLTDKNFDNFARFYAKYLAKYSVKKPDLPATAEDFIILPKLKEWLGQRLDPSQVKYFLKDLASTNVNKYLQLYLKDADNAIILPKLERWVGQGILPRQVKYNLNEIGITDTTQYVDWYMRNGGDDVVMTKLRKWLQEDVELTYIVPKLNKIGVADTTKYVNWYRDAPVLAKLREWVNQGLHPPQILAKLKEFGVTDLQRYAGTIGNLYGKRQAKLYRRSIS